MRTAAADPYRSLTRDAAVDHAIVVGWLARLHAAGRGHEAIDIVDGRTAIGRIDRSAGRAKWLGSAAERLRLAYFKVNDGLRRVLQSYALLQ